MEEKEILYENIMEKLKFEPNIDESNITIAIKEGGIIILGGTVQSFAEKQLAIEAVKKIEKVRGIADELDVNLALSYERSDSDIAAAAVHALQWTLFIPSEKIKVIVKEGVLTLVGDAEYNYQKERAQKVVQDLYGVIMVNNNIKIKPSISPSQVKENIIKEFERNARIDANNIQVEVKGSEVTLKGKVRNFDEDREARTAAWSIPGVAIVNDQLKIGV